MPNHVVGARLLFTFTIISITTLLAVSVGGRFPDDFESAADEEEPYSSGSEPTHDSSSELIDEVLQSEPITRQQSRPYRPQIRPPTRGGPSQSTSVRQVLAKLLGGRNQEGLGPSLGGVRQKLAAGSTGSGKEKGKGRACLQRLRGGRLVKVECGEPTGGNEQSSEEGEEDSAGLEELLAEVLESPNADEDGSSDSSEELDEESSSSEDSGGDALREAQQRLLARLKPLSKGLGKASSKGRKSSKNLGAVEDLSLESLLELEDIPDGKAKPSKSSKKHSKKAVITEIQPVVASCVSQWSEWSPASLCTRECGACASIIMRRACLSSPGCPCRWVYWPIYHGATV